MTWKVCAPAFGGGEGILRRGAGGRSDAAAVGIRRLPGGGGNLLGGLDGGDGVRSTTEGDSGDNGLASERARTRDG